MSAKRIVPRVAAEQDVEKAALHYAVEAGEGVAWRFAEALRDAYRTIGERPGAGSPRFGDLLNFPGLRSRRVGRFPYLVFYMESVDHIDVWRVLHARSDIPAWLSESKE